MGEADLECSCNWGIHSSRGAPRMEWLLRVVSNEARILGFILIADSLGPWAAPFEGRLLGESVPIAKGNA